MVWGAFEFFGGVKTYRRFQDPMDFPSCVIGGSSEARLTTHVHKHNVLWLWAATEFLRCWLRGALEEVAIQWLVIICDH